ncbi:hypothetical protein ENUP19_0166G0036 [Entamoeba nuttalli]|uniref:Uncharacterized protein n=1 Tax=Entamoeba nuttalli TaxID=412467 RepID=A0ABQ0DM52_9EUKA
MDYRRSKFKLSVLLSTIALEVRRQFSRAIDETTEIILYGLVYWFRIWDHEYNLKPNNCLLLWLDFLINDIKANLIDSKALVHLLTLVRKGYYQTDITHFN